MAAEACVCILPPELKKCRQLLRILSIYHFIIFLFCHNSASRNYHRLFVDDFSFCVCGFNDEYGTALTGRKERENASCFTTPSELKLDSTEATEIDVFRERMTY